MRTMFYLAAPHFILRAFWLAPFLLYLSCTSASKNLLTVIRTRLWLLMLSLSTPTQRYKKNLGSFDFLREGWLLKYSAWVRVHLPCRPRAMLNSELEKTSSVCPHVYFYRLHKSQTPRTQPALTLGIVPGTTTHQQKEPLYRAQNKVTKRSPKTQESKPAIERWRSLPPHRDFARSISPAASSHEHGDWLWFLGYILVLSSAPCEN